LAIPETQLETWAGIGATKGLAETYAVIKNALEAPGSDYVGKSYDIFLQGSYGNDTNVFRDSDVDVVIQLTSTYHYDAERLSAVDKLSFDRDFTPATYRLVDFKAHVLKQLHGKFPSQVTAGKKAIAIKGNDNRRDADVLVASDFHRYHKYDTPSVNSRSNGLCFFLPDGTRVENFPRIHSARCTTKHQDTKQWFKPVVRIFKNMRNRMIEEGALTEGIAPSYYLEGMLFNVPNDLFGGHYGDTFVRCFNWVKNHPDPSKLECANGLEWLVRDGRQTSWPSANFETYKIAAASFWNNWNKAKWI
jgi:hypothetical protein